MMKQKTGNPANNHTEFPVSQTAMNKGPFSGGMANMELHGAAPIGQSPLIPPSNFPSSSMVTQGLSHKNMAATSPAGAANQYPAGQVATTNQNGTVTALGAGSMMASSSSDMQQPQINGGLDSWQGQDSSPQQNLANTKEKTPMCLINELARFNKISHQYTLVDEQGPAHKKTFYVKLQLGDGEEYSTSGPSIKKAQHAAAKIALEKTTCKHPPPKQIRFGMRNYPVVDPSGLGLNNITPTVELNALAMKRGEPAVYKSLDNRPHPYPQQQQQYDYRGLYNQRYPYMRMPRMFYVSLKVGNREILGEGSTRQLARHNAATKALRILKSLPMPNMDQKSPLSDVPDVKPKEGEQDDEGKSEISLVHEIALRHSLPVSFDVIRESGPPHMKNFVTRCVVGEYTTEAEGNSKKISKKRAAELMLEELKKLPPLPASIMKPKNKPPVNKKKNRNLIKVNEMQKADPSYGVGINPISRLIQIQQSQKKKEPEYTLLAERGLPRRREFVIQVTVDDKTCTGAGPNKKLAKRHAAEAMLDLLGYNKPSPQPSKPAIRSGSPPETSTGEKKVTFVENSEESTPVVNGQGGRQLMPGLLLLPDGNMPSSSYSQLKAIAGQYQQGGNTMQGFGVANAEQQLREVGSKYKFEVKFDEFSGQSSADEYLSRVSVLTNPPQVMHGSGVTMEAARNTAAFNALKSLSEKGMIVLSENKVKVTPAGDGPKGKKEKNQLANSGKMTKRKE